MIFTIKKQGIATKEIYNIFDENNKLIYKIVKDLFSFTKQFCLYDTNKNLIGKIRQKHISVLPTYIISKNGIDIGTINKKATLFKTEFDIKYKNYDAKGDILNWNFDILNESDIEIAKISKDSFCLVSTYIINILNDEDVIDIILLVIAIEEINK